MQIRWLSGKKEWSAGGLQNLQNGHPQAPDPAKASTHELFQEPVLAGLRPKLFNLCSLPAEFQGGCTSHCLPCLSDTAGQPKHFVWEGSQNFRAGGALGGLGQ
eukprot:1145912-Pelagomonas_calceolata.AAC.1